MTDEWQEVACVQLPESLISLSDSELERLRQEIESNCVDAFLKLIDGDENDTAYADNGEPLTFDRLQKTMLEFRAKYGRPLRAIKISAETQRQMERLFPVYRTVTPADTLYGVQIEIDNDLELWECVPVYA
jgi:hypothetical protein